MADQWIAVFPAVQAPQVFTDGRIIMTRTQRDLTLPMSSTSMSRWTEPRIIEYAPPHCVAVFNNIRPTTERDKPFAIYAPTPCNRLIELAHDDVPLDQEYRPTTGWRQPRKRTPFLDLLHSTSSLGMRVISLDEAFRIAPFLRNLRIDLDEEVRANRVDAFTTNVEPLAPMRRLDVE